MANPDKTPPDPRKACRTCEYPEYVVQLEAEVVRLRQERDEEKALRMRLMEAVDADRGVVERLREALLAAANDVQNIYDDAVLAKRYRLAASPDKPPVDG